MKRVFVLTSITPAMLYGDTLALSSSLAFLASAGLGYSAYLLYRIARVKQERDQALEKQKADANILYLQSRYASMGETLGNIAHQWKQPLNAIGSIQNSIKAALIFQGEISKEKLLSSVDTSFGLLQHLAETIDTFYSFLAQSGNKSTLFYIADELEKVRKITEYSFENSNIRLVFELNINPAIQGNANEFTHALLNLILNAKDAFDTHTAENPTIIICVIGEEKTCTITVTDNAGGIRIKPLDIVFNLHISTKENGSGLGLFMTKNIIEKRFGGKIDVQNTKDGACFTITLPYAEYGEYFVDTVTLEEKNSLERINQLSHKIIELEEVERALQKWADIFKKAHWAIAIHIGTSNHFESTNEAFNSLYGYTSEELRNISVPDLFPKETLSILPDVQQQAFENGYTTFETINKRKDGSTFPVSVELIVIKDENGEILYHIANIWDLTEKKAAEERLVLKKVALDHIKDAVFLIDENARFHYVNQGAYDALGYTKEEFEHMSVGDVDPDWPRERWPEHWEVLKKAGSIRMELRHRRKDGTLFPVEVSANYIQFGEKHYNMAIARDITERRLLEEEKKNRIIKTVAENSPDVIIRYDVEGRRIYANPKAAELLGVEIGKSPSEATPIIDKELYVSELQKVIRTGTEATFEITYTNAAGGLDYSHIRMVPEFDDDGNISSVLMIGRNITDQKLAFDALAQKERELRALAESSPGMMGAYHMRPDGSVCMPYVSANIVDLFGVTPEEVSNDITALAKLHYPEDNDRIFETIAESAQNMSIWHQEFRILHPIKGERWMESHTKPYPHPDGGVIWYGYVHDITKRKAMEAALQEANERYVQILDNSTDVIYLIEVTSEGKFIYLDVNAAYVDLTGISRDNVIGLCVDDIADEIFRTILIDKFDSCLKAGCDTNYTADYPFPKGVRTFHSILTPIRNESGRIVRIVGSARDITEQSELQKELQKERKFLSDAQRVANTGSWYLDLTNSTLSWSDETYSMFELDKESVTDLHKTFYEYVHPEDREAVRAPYEESLKTREPYELQHRVLMPDGRIKYVVERCEHIYADDGTPLYSIGTVQDITERKLMEKELEDSHAFLTKLIDSLPDPIFVKDREHTWIILNKANYEFAGIEPGTFIGKSDYDFFPKDEADVFWAKDEEVFNSRQVNINEEYFTSSDGVTHYIQTIKAMFVGSDGKEYLVGTIRDLSERKAMEDDLRKALEFNEGIIGAIPDLLFEIAPDGTYVGVWAQNEELLIQQRSALLGKNFKELMPPDVVITSIQAMKEVDEKGMSLGKIYSLNLPDGERWFELSVSKKKMSGNYIALARDITERKNAEEQVQMLNATLEDRVKERTLQLMKALEFNEGIINALPDLLFEVDRHGKYLGVWTQNTQLLAAQREVLLNHTFDDILSPEATAIAMDAIREAEEKGLSFGKIIEIELTDEIHWFELSASKKSSDGTFIFISRDISERIKAEKSLQESEEMFRALVENSPDVISRYDLSMRRTYANPMMQFLLDKPLEEILGKTPREFSPLPNVEVFEEMFKAVVYGKTELEHEGLYQTPWGEIRCGNQRLVPEFDSDQNVTSVMVIGRDITERKNSEKELKLLETAINNAEEAVYIIDDNRLIIYVNDAACRMSGYTKKELEGKSILDIDVHFSEKDICTIFENKPSKTKFTFKTKHRTKEGNILNVEVNTNCFIYEGVGFGVSLVKELTEKKV